MSLQSKTASTQSRKWLRPVRTVARVGAHTVPPEWKSCISTEPSAFAHASMLGELTVPLLYRKSLQPMSSPRMKRNDGNCEAADPDSPCWAEARPRTPVINIAERPSQGELEEIPSAAAI
eukprot:2243127-Prymnesium_polylepis.1